MKNLQASGTIAEKNIELNSVSFPETNRRAGYPVDTSVQLKTLLDEYSVNSNPIAVSFRKLVPWLKVGSRATHYLHPYPAKLFPQIAHFFLASNELSPSGAVVLDPFSGSGTVALEAILSGRNAIYADVNPFAQLLTSAKTTLFDPKRLEILLPEIKSNFLKSRTKKIPDVVNVDLWFSPKNLRALSRLKAAIDKSCPAEFKDFVEITFSSTCKKVSNADPRFNVPVRRKEKNIKTGKRELVDNSNVNAWEVFEKAFTRNLGRLRQFVEIYPGDMDVKFAGSDALSLLNVQQGCPLQSDSVDLIITSPPYAGAQKYIRSSSLSLGWLGLAKSKDLKILESMSIGREHFPKVKAKEFIPTSISSADIVLKKVFEKNPLRACIASSFLLEMRIALDEAYRVLKPGGHIVLVIGNNKICGHEFKSSEYLSKILLEAGAEVLLSLVDAIPSRTLTTSRADTASVIKNEHIVLFRKPKIKR